LFAAISPVLFPWRCSSGACCLNSCMQATGLDVRTVAAGRRSVGHVLRNSACAAKFTSEAMPWLQLQGCESIHACCCSFRLSSGRSFASPSFLSLQRSSVAVELPLCLRLSQFLPVCLDGQVQNYHSCSTARFISVCSSWSYYEMN
jgi:hypothetical protein